MLKLTNSSAVSCKKHHTDTNHCIENVKGWKRLLQMHFVNVIQTEKNLLQLHLKSMCQKNIALIVTYY